MFKKPKLIWPIMGAQKSCKRVHLDGIFGNHVNVPSLYEDPMDPAHQFDHANQLRPVGPAVLSRNDQLCVLEGEVLGKRLFRVFSAEPGVVLRNAFTGSFGLLLVRTQQRLGEASDGLEMRTAG